LAGFPYRLTGVPADPNYQGNVIEAITNATSHCAVQCLQLFIGEIAGIALLHFLPI
jgi:hypothetical protein